MGTRIRSRKSIQHIYNHYIIFEQKWKPNGHLGNEAPTIKFVYPPIREDEKDLVERVKSFAFPTDEKITSIENFSFVLTNGGGEWTFGYCRQQPGPRGPSPTAAGDTGRHECIMILSSIPYWNAIFYKILNYCVCLRNWDDVHESFLMNLYQSSVAESALENCAISVESKQSLPPFTTTCPNTKKLPSTLDNRCLAEFYNSLSIDSMITLFASLLAERRIFVTSSKLSRLSSIVMACNILMYPMCWQHVLIPVLPQALSDYLETPCPIIVGVPIQTWRNGFLTRKLSQTSMNDIIHVDADSGRITSPFPEDVLDLPNDIISFLKTNLKIVKKIGADGLAKVFLHAFVRLMGHIENSLVIDKNQLRLDHEMFIQLAKSSHRKYIKTKLLHSQMFQQFSEEMIGNIKSGRNRSDDIFCQEISSITASSCGNPCGKKSTLPREKATSPGKLQKSHMNGSVSVLSISNPMPITPDLIRFSEPATTPVAATLPRSKTDNSRNNNNYDGYNGCNGGATTKDPTSRVPNTNGLKSNSLKQGMMNPGWNDSWKHVVNDLKSTRASAPVVPTLAPPTPMSQPPSSITSTTSTIPDKLGGDEDLINLDDTSLEASVHKYEDLLREYGLYDFYTTTATKE